MPLALPPLTVNELEAVRLWIEEGATRNGVVAGTGELLDACLPPPSPLEVEPLPPPAPGTGVQIRAPHQVLPPNGEREVCFVSYFDLTDQVPEEFRSPDGRSFRFKHLEARQDPHSHHAVTIVYKGSTDIHDPVWGAFACRGGEHDGDACEPTDISSCGTTGVCASPPVPSLACIGFGPGDAGIGIAEESLFNTMASNAGDVDGVYDEAPLKGILVWNSHAFNLANVEAKLDMWINFEFAAPEEQVRKLRRLVDISAISKMAPRAYGVDEVCNAYVAPRNAEFIDMSSHEHKRGKRFRVFQGAFTCQGGANDGDACSPFGPDPGLRCATCAAAIPALPGNRRAWVTATRTCGSRSTSWSRLSTSRSRSPRCRPARRPTATRTATSRSTSCSVVSARPSHPSFATPRKVSSIRASPTSTRRWCALSRGSSSAGQGRRRSSGRSPTADFTTTVSPNRTRSSAIPRRRRTEVRAVRHTAPEGTVGRPCVGSTTAERDRSCD